MVCSTRLGSRGMQIMNEKEIQEKIAEQIQKNDVVLYMKGTPQFPMCGFSGTAVKLLHSCGIKHFLSINVLDDPDIRKGIKEFSNWPTIPQLYVQGEFVGGSDIMKDMAESGELSALLKKVLPENKQ